MFAATVLGLAVGGCGNVSIGDVDFWPQQTSGPSRSGGAGEASPAAKRTDPSAARQGQGDRPADVTATVPAPPPPPSSTLRPGDGAEGPFGGPTGGGYGGLALPAPFRPYGDAYGTLGATRVTGALLLPLSGRNAALGRAMLHAAEIALFETADGRFEIRPYDTGDTDNGAARAAQRAVEDGADIILGPIFSSSVPAAARAARRAGIPVVAFSSDKSVAEAGVYTMGFFPGDQVERVVMAASGEGRKRFAALVTDDGFGSMALDATRNALARTGGALVRVERISPTLKDLAPVIRRLADYDRRKAALKQRVAEVKALPESDPARRELDALEKRDTLGDPDFDALVLPLGGELLTRAASLLPYYDIDADTVRILGTGQWDVPGIGNEPGLVGAWYAAPAPANRTTFERRFKDLHGRDAPRLATLAYDATALSAFLARQSPGRPFERGALESPLGFGGLDGIFRLTRSGEVDRRLAVIEVRPKGIRIVDAAPQRFADLSN